MLTRALLALVVLGTCQLMIGATPTKNWNGHGPNDLSDQAHEHNPEYDHGAFLGTEQAEHFDQLSHAEAKRRLGLIVDKIDRDSNGKVTQEELQDWIRHVTKRPVYEDVDRHWGYHDKDSDELIGWEEYKKVIFGMVENLDDIYDPNRKLTFKQVIARDERRFKSADQDSNGLLDREEFAAFLHPHEVPHMRNIAIDETMEEMDEDKDGFVTMEEFINQLWSRFEPEEKGREREGKEPDWVATERELFVTDRDKNGDGKLDWEELGNWMLPLGHDIPESEANYLILEADLNKDTILTKDEILKNQDLFVGSRVTNFGNYVMKDHDEF